MEVSIEEKLKVLPMKPGCYLMKNKHGTVIYVGKSKVLRNRVRSYFKGTHDEKTERLVLEITDLKLNEMEEKIMAIVDVTDQNFVQDTAEGLVLVDFWAPWCGPCKMIAPVLEELDDELGDKVKIVKLNVDDNQETAGKFGVMSIPTLLLMKDGNVVDQVVGFQPKEALADLVNKHA